MTSNLYRDFARDFANTRVVSNKLICLFQDSPERTSFLRKIEQLMMKMVTYAPVDAACDQMSKNYIHDTLPPVLTESKSALYSNVFYMFTGI